MRVTDCHTGRHSRQRLVGADAGVAGDSTGIGVSSKLSRNFVNPALHVGEQIAGRGGWCASGSSGGIAGGATTAGGDGGETLLHSTR
jgi:hypothetical protein